MTNVVPLLNERYKTTVFTADRVRTRVVKLRKIYNSYVKLISKSGINVDGPLDVAVWQEMMVDNNDNIIASFRGTSDEIVPPPNYELMKDLFYVPVNGKQNPWKMSFNETLAKNSRTTPLKAFESALCTAITEISQKLLKNTGAAASATEELR